MWHITSEFPNNYCGEENIISNNMISWRIWFDNLSVTSTLTTTLNFTRSTLGETDCYTLGDNLQSPFKIMSDTSFALDSDVAWNQLLFLKISYASQIPLSHESHYVYNTFTQTFFGCFFPNHTRCHSGSPTVLIF